MQYLSSDFVVRNPQCLEARDSLELMIALSEHDTVATLRDLLSMTAIAEREYARLPRYRRRQGDSSR